jgi:DNA-binding PadR family transcriptional regulator
MSHLPPDDEFNDDDPFTAWHAAGRRRTRPGGRAGRVVPPIFGGSGGGFGGFPPGGPPGGFSPPAGLPWALWSLFRGRGPRARRGNVRAAILALLAEQPRNGYQIMRELAERSQGAWRPSPGSVYPQLQQLEDEGLVHEEASGVAPGGRVFALTDAGRAYVAKHRDELAAAWETASPGDNASAVVATATQIRHIVGAAMQIAHGGGAAQVAAAQRILAEARRGLYGVLAEGGDADADTEDDE